MAVIATCFIVPSSFTINLSASASVTDDADVPPSSIDNSSLVTAETATFPEPFETKALEAVRLVSSMVVAAPVIVACLALSWV